MNASQIPLPPVHRPVVKPPIPPPGRRASINEARNYVFKQFGPALEALANGCPPPPQSFPRDLQKCFAADCFDPRFVENTAERHLTPLGLLVNSYYWYRTHELKCGLAFRPIANSMCDMIGRLAPDALVDLERHINEQANANDSSVR